MVSDFNSFQDWLNFTGHATQQQTHANNSTNNITMEKIDKSSKKSNKTFKILHIITTLQEYDDGGRGTTKRNDRLQNMLIPVLKQTVESIIENKPGWQIDVYLILGYKLKPKRRKIVQDAIPNDYGVGLEIWDRAIPYYGAMNIDKPRDDIRELRTALARQHRYVIRDKYDHYDLFSCWVSFILLAMPSTLH